MKSFFRQAACAFILVASLNGCAETPGWMDSSKWFGGSVAHRSVKGEAPTPEAAPVEPVQSQLVTPSVLSSKTYEPKVKVGVLLPLTGPNAGLGHAMLNAAQQAVFDAAAQNFDLMPRDTGGTDASAAQAARDAIAGGAQLLVGPLFASQVPAVAKVAGPANIPVLTLSTDTSLAAPGIYVMGFAPGAQAERVARLAMSRGLKRFAALVPNDSYGTLVGESFQLAVAREGGIMVSLNIYDPAKHNSDVAIHDLSDKSGVIDALFLPEGGSDLALISKQLAAVGFDPKKIHMLGTGLWDAYDTGHVAPLVVGGWYAAPDPAVRQGFVASYKSTYNEDPPRLTTLAYDATALAAALAKRGARFDKAALTNPNGFAGLDGIFRLKSTGEVERGLAVLEIDSDGSHVIDSAPPTFVGSKW